MSILLLHHPLPTCTHSTRTLLRAVVRPREAFCLKPSFSSHTHEAVVSPPFGKSSLGLDRNFIVPYLESICQLPEVDAAWKDLRRRHHHPRVVVHSATVESLRRAGQIFERMAPKKGGGGEHGAVTALLAEVQHRQGMYLDAIHTLDELLNHQVTKNQETHEGGSLSFDVFLAKAKVQWTLGNFDRSHEICEALISDHSNNEEYSSSSSSVAPSSTVPVTSLQMASAMTGRALSQLTRMDTMDQAFDVRDNFRVTLKYLERSPMGGSSSSSLPPNSLSLALAAAYSNAGAAEAIYNMFVEERNNVSVPMDAALKTWFQGLQKVQQPSLEGGGGGGDAMKDSQLYRASNYLRSSIQADLAWGVLNYEHDRKDRLKKASDYAKKALDAYGPESTTEDDGLRKVLSIVASCYHEAGSAVTAEGLYQSAISRKIPPQGPLQRLELYDALLGYSNLLSKWDKRERDAERLKEDASRVLDELPAGWRGKSVVHSSLWFWTPADFL